MALKSKPFSEQIALVTGGGSGIGLAFAEALCRNVATVVIASRRAETLQRAAAELNDLVGSERVYSYRLDIRLRGEVEALVDHIIARWKSIDLVINNSGLAEPETITEITDSGWDKVIETNLRGPMWLIRAALPHMIAADFGDIVNVSSQAGKHGYADVPSYCASKFGLLGLAESVRDHVRKMGCNVRVFNFCPALVDVDHRGENEEPRTGSLHVLNMARTLMFALSLDRDVVLDDINIYAR